MNEINGENLRKLRAIRISQKIDELFVREHNRIATSKEIMKYSEDKIGVDFKLISFIQLGIKDLFAEEFSTKEINKYLNFAEKQIELAGKKQSIKNK